MTRQPAEPAQTYAEIYFTAQDGLKLYAREYGPKNPDQIPVVCLAGFTRNSADFHDLALHLCSSRRVLAPDYRGRGKSAYAPGWRTYSPWHELLDTLDLMTARGVHEAIVIGTSRGGLIAMQMAVVRPTAIKAVVLNDIGPVIERRGLLRISGQLDNRPTPADWNHAAAIVAQTNGHALPGLDEETWMTLARRSFKETKDGLAPNYDRALVHAFKFAAAQYNADPPDLWPLFKALDKVPVLAIRGALSELLSADTLNEMARRHPNLATLTVENRGHVPLLDESGVVAAIDDFIAKV